MPNEYKEFVERLRLHDPFKGLSKKERELVTITHVGASNPYALAKVLAFKRDHITINWEDYTENPDGAKALLGNYLGSPYETLFDPYLCPILYIGVYPMPLTRLKPLEKGEGWLDRGFIRNPIRENLIRAQVKDAAKKEGKKKEGTNVAASVGSGALMADIPVERIHEQLNTSFVRIASLQHLVALPGESQELMMVIVPGVGATSTKPGEHNIWDDIPGVYFTRVSGSMNGYQDNQDDIIQGILPDCYLLASLASWCWFKRWPKKTQVAAADYTIKLTDLYMKRLDIKCNGELPLPAIDAPHPVFADVTPQNEVYPGIYEKAYTDLRFGQDSPVESNNNLRNPDVSLLTSGDPILALQAISGGIYSVDGVGMPNNEITVYYTKSDPNSPGTGLDVPENRDIFTAQFDAYGKVKNPMVAWTYYTGSGGNTGGRPTPPPDTYYVADWMVANHAYAVLGLKRLPPTPVINPQYVILRNPFGPTYGGKPDLDMQIYPGSSDSEGIYKNAYLWKPLASYNYTVNIGQTTYGTKIKPDGIFAIKLDQFLKYFEAVGWCINTLDDM